MSIVSCFLCYLKPYILLTLFFTLLQEDTSGETDLVLSYPCVCDGVKTRKFIYRKTILTKKLSSLAATVCDGVKRKKFICSYTVLTIMFLSAAAANCMRWIERKKFYLIQNGAEEKSLDNSCVLTVCDGVK